MATVQCTLRSERWLDEVIIEGTRANVDGEVADTYALPQGIGDVAIMSVEYLATGIATIVTPTLLSVFMEVFEPNQAVAADVVGSGELRIRQTGAQIGATVDPDALTLWRQNEYLSVVHPELDSNVAPTVDYTLRAKCVRVRPVEAPVGPIQLVR